MSSKHYGISGIGSLVDVGKGGPKIKSTGGVLECRANDDNSYSIFRCADPVGADAVVTNRFFDVKRMYQSAGIAVMPSWHDNNDGTANLGTGTVRLYTSSAGTGTLEEYTLAAVNNMSFTNGITQYVVATYSGGTASLSVTPTVADIDETHCVPVYSVFRYNTTLYKLPWNSLAYNLSTRLHYRLVKTDRFRRENGLMLTEATGRITIVSEGRVFYGVDSILLGECISGTDEYNLGYHVTSAWTRTPITQYNNSQYDDGVDLQDLSPNRYAVNWVYRGVDDTKHCCILLGQGDYHYDEAVASQPPATPPPFIGSHNILVGRIIVKNGDTTATTIDSAFTVDFTAGGVVYHNDTLNKQGGSDVLDQFYHLTLAEHTIAVASADATKDGYLTKGNFSAFAAKMSNPLTATGDLIYGDTTTPTRLPIGADHTVLHSDGTIPVWAAVTEADFAFTNITTANATSSQHGLLPRLSNVASQYFNGQGNWATPSGATTSYTTQSFTAQTTINLTHNFGTYPVVQVINDSGVVVIPASITNNTVNDLTVVLAAAMSGYILATVGGPQGQSVRSISDNYPAVLTDRIIECTVAGKTVTLYTAVGHAGLEVIVDNASTGSIFVTGTQTINGETTQTIPAGSAIAMYSTGAVWRIY